MDWPGIVSGAQLLQERDYHSEFLHGLFLFRNSQRMRGAIPPSNIQTRSTEKLNKIVVLYVLLMEVLKLSTYESRHFSEVSLCQYHYEKPRSRKCLFYYPI
jgi:hypothetical protein